MPPFVLEIVANVLFYLAGSMGSQALKQAVGEGRTAVGIGFALAFLAAAFGGAWFIDTNITMLDYVIWAVLYGIGFFSGWRREG
jgi:cytochrome c biogenesis protein CcdA